MSMGCVSKTSHVRTSCQQIMLPNIILFQSYIDPFDTQPTSSTFIFHDLFAFDKFDPSPSIQAYIKHCTKYYVGKNMVNIMLDID